MSCQGTGTKVKGGSEVKTNRSVQSDSGEYESPRITDYGDFSEQTQHDGHGDPLNADPLHDPHLTGSI